MGNGIHQVRAYVSDMLNATRSMLKALTRQLRAREFDAEPEIRWVLESLARMLAMHSGELSEHLLRLGAACTAQESASGSLATDLLDAAVRHIPPEPAAKALRDYYTALSLAQAGALMLETNARALGFSSTAALATRHREEMTAMLARIRDQLPAAVKGEVALQERERSA